MATLEVELPRLHQAQWRAHRCSRDARADSDERWARNSERFKAIRCGRRWGKTTYGEIVACEAALEGKTVGYFVPTYKFQTEVYNDITRYLAPVIVSSSKMEQVIRLITGGRIDFWTLEDERAGRSRKYHLVIIDEAAFSKPETMDTWERSIKPTL